MIEQEIQNSAFVETCKNATIEALKGKVSDEDIAHLLSFMNGDTVLSEKGATSDSGPGPQDAKTELYTIGIYGHVKCTPTHFPYEYNANHWGLGASVMTTYGIMYTAYNTWEAFFRETRGYHAQGIAKGGGILQITWFNGKGTPIGRTAQFCRRRYWPVRSWWQREVEEEMSPHRCYDPLSV